MWWFPSSFGSIQLKVWEEMSFEEFQYGHHGGHLGYQNVIILAILNLCVTVMPPIKFRLNQTYGLGGDAVWRISRWLPWPPAWISEWNDFSNSEYLCHCDASHPVFALSDLWFWDEMSSEEFQDGHHAILISEQNNFSNSEPLCHCDASHQVLAQSDLRFGRRCRLKNFKMATMAAILDIRTERF